MTVFGVNVLSPRAPAPAILTQGISIAESKAQLKGGHILLAEDNPTNQEIALAVLESAGITVSVVNNGQEAVRAVCTPATCPYDAILMDVQMPKMNGYDATRKIRQTPGLEGLPIIAMTAHAMKGDEEKCLEAGMNGYITKPINQNTLFTTLATLKRPISVTIEESQFVVTHRATIAKIKKAFEQQAWDELAPLAHLLAEHAEQIGQVKIKNMAMLIHKFCMARRSFSNALVTHLENELDLVFSQLQRDHNESATPSP